MTVLQHDDFTVIATPTHLRANDSKARPVAVLFDDPTLDTVAELRLTPERARALADALHAAADAADEAEPSVPVRLTTRELDLACVALLHERTRTQANVDAGHSLGLAIPELTRLRKRLRLVTDRLDAADALTHNHTRSA